MKEKNRKKENCIKVKAIIQKPQLNNRKNRLPSKIWASNPLLRISILDRNINKMIFQDEKSLGRSLSKLVRPPCTCQADNEGYYWWLSPSRTHLLYVDSHQKSSIVSVTLWVTPQPLFGHPFGTLVQNNLLALYYDKRYN